jgi:hypothetical protein
MRTKGAIVSFKAEATLKALFPEMSRLHGNKAISAVIRRLLWQEAERLNLVKPDEERHIRTRHRHRT